MYLTAEHANAWTDELGAALSHASRLTEQQKQFLASMQCDLKAKGAKLPITSRQLATMKHLTNHAVAEEV